MAFISTDITTALGNAKRVRSTNLRGALSTTTVMMNGSMFAAPNTAVGDVILLCPITLGASIKSIRMAPTAPIGTTVPVQFSIGVYGINPGYFNPTGSVYTPESFTEINPALLRAAAVGAGTANVWAELMNLVTTISGVVYTLHDKTLYQLLTLWNNAQGAGAKLFDPYKNAKEVMLGLRVTTLATIGGIGADNKVAMIIEYVDMTVSANETLMDIGH